MVEKLPKIISRQSYTMDNIKKGIVNVSRSVRAYIYLVLTAHVQAGLSIVGKSASVVDAQQ